MKSATETNPNLSEKFHLLEDRMPYDPAEPLMAEVAEPDGIRTAATLSIPSDDTCRKVPLESSGSFCCVLEKMPTTSCQSPFRCQQKLRLSRKLLRRSSSQITCATGLELAAGCYLGSLKLPRLNQAKLRKLSLDSSSPVNRVTDAGTGTEKFFHSTAVLPSISCLTDWLMDDECLYCLKGALSQSEAVVLASGPKVSPTDSTRTRKASSDLITARIERILTESGCDRHDHQNSVSETKSRKSGKMTVQRKYSAAELTAAIVEVEKGKVGTRKAAFLYGIPRSTLRNKVGKLTAQKALSASEFTTLPDPPANSKALIREKPIGLKRAASADLTSALKEIISRHITEKTKVDGSDGDKYRDPLRYKRGRYRRYDKGDLEEALKVVRKGEMTVHRAGHFFGIPHSTLEYKIKERNIVAKCPSIDDPRSKSSSPIGFDRRHSLKVDDKERRLSSATDNNSVPAHAAIRNDAPEAAASKLIWPGDISSMFNFNFGQLSFPSPFAGLFGGYPGQIPLSMTPDKLAAAYLAAGHASNQMPFVVPFRPWVPMGTTFSGQSAKELLLSGADRTIDIDDNFDEEPLDLIKKDPGVAIN